MTTAQEQTGAARRPRRLWWALGPAFVAAIAYVDPGNVAANLTAGATYGYLLVWVLIAANLMAVLVQYLSAKLGLVTGDTLPGLIGARLKRPQRLAFWLQAELVAAATDLAEVVGGAIALNILFGLPLLVGGVIVGAVSMALLLVQSSSQRRFEHVVVALLAVIGIGFVCGLFVTDVSWADAAAGIVPRFQGSESVLLAASMLGATVMPHAIYLHSGLTRDHFAHVHPRQVPASSQVPDSSQPVGRDEIPRLLRMTRLDVVSALLIAGGINIAMLLLAASSLQGVGDTDTIGGAHAAIALSLGPAVGLLFGIGLLASGLASTSVGSYAGATIMAGLLKVKVPLVWRRLLTLLPALVVLASGFDPTRALVLSQVVLSLGIPFALIPLVRLTSDRTLMGRFANARGTTVIAWLVAAAIVTLNVALLVLTVAG